MKKLIQKINNIHFEKNSFLISYIALALISLLIIAKDFYQINMKLRIIAIIALIVFGIIIYFLLKKALEKNIKIHNLYLILIIICGIFYIFGFPPNQLPDDRSDYLRSLEVSDFHLTSVKKGQKVGRNYPKNIDKVYASKNYKEYWKNRNIKLEGQKDFMVFANKSLYAFVCYVPQAIGVGIMKVFKAPIVFQILLGKICNFAFFVILTYLSIKYIPKKKGLLFCICLLPIVIQEATSLSADCMTIATAIALESFVIWSRETEKKFEKKHYITLSLLVLCLSLSKIVYIPICFTILLIPQKCFQTNHKKILYSTILLVTVMILNLWWLKISSNYLVSFMDTRGSNSHEQLMYILKRPWEYAIILVNTIDNYSYAYLDQMVGHSLGAFSVTTSYIFAILMLGILGYLIMKKNKSLKPKLDNIETIYVLLLTLGTIVLIFTSLYLQWTPVYAPLIDGVQGRYFIPLLPLIAMLFITNKKEQEKWNYFILCTIIMFNIVAIFSIYHTYW